MLVSDQLCVYRLTLKDRHKTEHLITDDQVNSLGLFMTDDLFIPMRLFKAADQRCDMVVRNGWTSDDTTAKNDRKEDGKGKEIREEKDRRTNLFPIICD